MRVMPTLVGPAPLDVDATARDEDHLRPGQGQAARPPEDALDPSALAEAGIEDVLAAAVRVFGRYSREITLGLDPDPVGLGVRDLCEQVPPSLMGPGRIQEEDAPGLD